VRSGKTAVFLKDATADDCHDAVNGASAVVCNVDMSCRAPSLRCAIADDLATVMVVETMWPSRNQLKPGQSGAGELAS
jgi:hypothetical protein